MPVDRRRAFGLTILNARNKDIRRLKRAGHEAAIHGNRCWDTSYLLLSHLQRHPLPGGARVLELGAGWGLAGIYCAERFDCRVTATDADPAVFPFLRLHAELNRVRVATRRAGFKELTCAQLAEFELLLGCEICFWDEHTRVLYNLILRARRAGCRQFILADPGRPPFHALAKLCLGRFAGARLLSRSIRRPVVASGELLLIDLQKPLKRASRRP